MYLLVSSWWPCLGTWRFAGGSPSWVEVVLGKFLALPHLQFTLIACFVRLRHSLAASSLATMPATCCPASTMSRGGAEVHPVFQHPLMHKTNFCSWCFGIRTFSVVCWRLQKSSLSISSVVFSFMVSLLLQKLQEMPSSHQSGKGCCSWCELASSFQQSMTNRSHSCMSWESYGRHWCLMISSHAQSPNPPACTLLPPLAWDEGSLHACLLCLSPISLFHFPWNSIRLRKSPVK